MSAEHLRAASPELRLILARNIRARRAETGMTQEDLAALTGLHRTYIGSVERCERNVTLSTLEVFARAFGTSVPALLIEERR